MIDQIFAEFRELTWHDLVMWKKPRATGVVVATIALFLIVFGWLEYTIVTFTCRVLQLSMIAYGVALKLDKPVLSATDVVEGLFRAVDRSKPYIKTGLTTLTKVVMWEEDAPSTKVLGVSILVAMVGNLFSDLTLVLLITVGIFAGPKLYVQNKEKIDAQLGELKRHAEQTLQSVPSSSAAKKTE
jgi:hypothetical protein